MSIKVVANNYLLADKVEEYLAIAKELVAKTNELDKGCIGYDLYKDVADPLHYTMIEEWETQEALNAHMASEHFQRLIPGLGASADNSKVGGITIYEKAF
jgi:quinol monooxygenase YgiN